MPAAVAGRRVSCIAVVSDEGGEHARICICPMGAPNDCVCGADWAYICCCCGCGGANELKDCDMPIGALMEEDAIVGAGAGAGAAAGAFSKGTSSCISGVDMITHASWARSCRRTSAQSPWRPRPSSSSLSVTTPSASDSVVGAARIWDVSVDVAQKRKIRRKYERTCVLYPQLCVGLQAGREHEADGTRELLKSRAAGRRPTRARTSCGSLALGGPRRWQTAFHKLAHILEDELPDPVSLHVSLTMRYVHEVGGSLWTLLQKVLEIELAYMRAPLRSGWHAGFASMVLLSSVN